MMSDIDPVQFGALTAQVKSLDDKVSALESDVKQLLELANKSKGGFWMGMTIAASAGAVVSWLLTHFNISVK